MTINSFDRKMFHQAYVEATKSTHDRFHIGCVVVYKHKIIGRGHNSNKTHPIQKKYNERYREFKFCDNSGSIHHSLHAEISALLGIPYYVGKDVDFSKVSMYVYRICPGRKRGYGLSKPCPACEAFIRDMGIKSVYYTDNSGLAYIEYC